jgi:indolepyruvate ferredoxin oxidoreductase
MNTAEMATGDFVKHRDANLRAEDRLGAISTAVHSLSAIDANRLAVRLMGDSIYANVLMLGYAWQLGLVPVSEAALERAIELNAVKVERNKQAFAWGRIAAADPDRLQGEEIVDTSTREETLDAMVDRRAAFLLDYQDEALAERYRREVANTRAIAADIPEGENLARAVARSYFKLLAYKDEYEVARLHTRTGFLEGVREQFGPSAKVRFHLAPPVLNGKRDARGRPLKKSFGRWMIPVFRLLAGMRRLRGSAFDVFGMTRERRMERELIAEFEQTVSALQCKLDESNVEQAIEIVQMYMDIRGYGPVKEQAVAEVRKRVEAALEAYLPPVDKAA